MEDQIGEGDKVTTCYTMSGAYQGEFFGVPGSGKHIEISGINVDRFDESGRMVEEWASYDLLWGRCVRQARCPKRGSSLGADEPLRGKRGIAAVQFSAITAQDPRGFFEHAGYRPIGRLL